MNPELLLLKFAPFSAPILAATTAIGLGQADAFAAVGATVATLVAYAEARDKQVTIGSLIMKLLVTLFGGMVLPALVYQSGLIPKIAFGLFSQSSEMTWHTWAILGFITGTFAFAGYNVLLSVGNSLLKKYSR